MACRCSERRDAIKQAAQARTVGAAVDAARFVVRTMAEDAGRRLVRSSGDRRKG